ncbi:anthranilate phosphoribosyltransferase [Candidatus Blochmanniella floridana]|uniref:Anthranilate phosphoribosyltransferase n=1 Tax=Blochmanniella floridana TaxID=203907 RepID=Q7VR02_BLOFL|nr:anthranilate phosphoribosyltransferase [Candidatus Blochmannia floridanus]
MTIKKILHILYQGDSLNKTQTAQLMHSIIHKQLSPIQITAALISMKIQGETIEEIVGSARTLLTYSKPCFKPNSLFADITGTGGDGKHTINISTASALVASTCNVKIIKHGNYTISGLSGSMDFLTLYNIDSTNKINQNLKNFTELGICFLCASEYYSIFKDIQYIRKQLNTPTLFNIIGPLINPARPPFALIGVYKKELLFPVAQALKQLNYNRAIVVHGDGIDEVSLHHSTTVLELYDDGRISDYTVTPEDFGLHTHPIQELYCDSKQTAYNSIINILQGKGKPSHMETVAANVALLLKLFGQNDLRLNASNALNQMYNGEPYKKLLSLSRLNNNIIS